MEAATAPETRAAAALETPARGSAAGRRRAVRRAAPALSTGVRRSGGAAMAAAAAPAHDTRSARAHLGRRGWQGAVTRRAAGHGPALRPPAPAAATPGPLPPGQ